MKRSRVDIRLPEPDRSQQSCTDKKSRIKVLRPQSARSLQLNTQSKRSSPARFKVLRTLSAPSPSRFQLNPQSESSGSSPASGSLQLKCEVVPSVLMDIRRKVLLTLFNVKYSMAGTQWKATDDIVLNMAAKMFNGAMSIPELHKHVVEMENAVKLDMENVIRIVQDRDSYMHVFDYVTPDYVPSTPTQDVNAIGEGLRNSKKMKTTSCQSDSRIGEQFSNLNSEETVNQLFNGEWSMKNCTIKAKSCGFEKDTLYEVIDLLKDNWEYRQIFMELDTDEAKGYMERKLLA